MNIISYFAFENPSKNANDAIACHLRAQPPAFNSNGSPKQRPKKNKNEKLRRMKLKHSSIHTTAETGRLAIVHANDSNV